MLNLARMGRKRSQMDGATRRNKLATTGASVVGYRRSCTGIESRSAHTPITDVLQHEHDHMLLVAQVAIVPDALDRV
jgi:hypothetical protein